MPIALLEAIAYGLPVLASDIEANLALGLDETSYFPLGNIHALSAAVRSKMEMSDSATSRSARSAASRIISKYDWRTIGVQTAKIYRSVASANTR